MIKQYLNDGLIQIAILLSLLRTDLIHLGVPNNEILNYPEVQDILQGQTLAYLPTSFHNQYNTLNSIHGYAHPKHADNDFYFSSIFHQLERFRGVSTNIEAFLVSADGTVDLPSPEPGNVSPQGQSLPVTTNTGSDDNGNPQSLAEVENSVSQAQAEATVDANHNPVDVESDFDNPFPGLNLCKEDLDLIEVLWRQDVDLGVGKEVFDPNLRRELEQERALELHKEQEKRKEAEKQKREKQQQAHQWLTQNFVRDGETGEWLPINGTDDTTSFAPPGPADLPSESLLDQPVTLEEALNFVGELQSGNSAEQQHQSVPQALPSGQYLPSGAEFQYLPDSLVDESEISNFTAQNQTNKDRFEQSWQEIFQYISDTNTTTSAPSSTITTNTTTTMPPVDTDLLMAPEPDMANLSQPQVFNQQHYHQQPLNSTLEYLLSEPTPNHTVSAAASMNETRRLLRQNSSTSDTLAGLLQNATLPMPAALDNSLSVLDIQPLAGDSGAVSQDYNTSNPAQDTLPPLGLEGADLLFPNTTDLTHLAGSINSADLLNATDLLTGILPAEDLDMAIDEGLESIQLLDDTGSDSAISMGSGSPRQEVNETMNLSPFDGLEGATGGSDYDPTSYSHRRNHTQGGGSAEDESSQYSCSSYGSPASVNTNCSTGSNDTEHSSSLSSTGFNHVHHNHTYPTQPGQTPREVKKYAKRDGPRPKGPQSRDTKRAEDLKLPFSFDRIVESPVEEFNEMITKTKLTEAQIALMRDIRRRGKNKVAAQNCRKRKLDVLVNLEDEMTDMEKMRDKLAEERRLIDQQTRQAKEKYAALYDHIFRSLRDEHGRPYNPAEFSLQESSDGNVFLVRKATGNATSSVVSSSSSAAQQQFQGPPSSSSSSSSGSRSKDYSKQHKDFPSQKKKSRE